jgi:hypothetical protein
MLMAANIGGYTITYTLVTFASTPTDAIEVARLDPKPLNVRATGPKRVEVNSRHLSLNSFYLSK